MMEARTISSTSRHSPFSLPPSLASLPPSPSYIKGVVKEIIHESGRGAPVARVQFKNAYRFKRDTESFVAVEGLYSGKEGGREGGREGGVGGSWGSVICVEERVYVLLLLLRS